MVATSEQESVQTAYGLENAEDSKTDKKQDAANDENTYRIKWMFRMRTAMRVRMENVENSGEEGRPVSDSRLPGWDHERDGSVCGDGRRQFVKPDENGLRAVSKRLLRWICPAVREQMITITG